MDGIEILCGALGEETRVCTALATALRREQQAMQTFEPRAILACLRERSALQVELAALAECRRALVRDVGRRSGRQVTGAGELLAALPPEAAARLGGSLRALRRALLEVRECERRTAATRQPGREEPAHLA